MLFNDNELTLFYINVENVLRDRIEETYLPENFFTSDSYTHARRIFDQFEILRSRFLDYNQTVACLTKVPQILENIPYGANIENIAIALHTMTTVFQYIEARHEYLFYVSMTGDTNLDSYNLEKYQNAREALANSEIPFLRKYLTRLESETDHAQNVLRTLLKLPEASQFSIHTLIYTALLHDIGKFWRGDREGMIIESVFPFLHQDYGVLDIRENFEKLGISSDIDEIMQAVSLHSSKCWILDQLRMDEGKWRGHDRRVQELTQTFIEETGYKPSQAFKHLVAVHERVRTSGFQPMPKKSKKSLLAHLLSDADNIAQLTIFQQNEFTQSGVSKSKFFQLLEIQMIADGKNNILDILDEMEERFTVLTEPNGRYTLTSEQAVEILEEQHHHFTAVKDEIKLHNEREQLEENKIVELNDRMLEEERIATARHNMNIVNGIVDNYLERHLTEVQTELRINTTVELNAELKPVINGRNSRS